MQRHTCSGRAVLHHLRQTRWWLGHTWDLPGSRGRPGQLSAMPTCEKWFVSRKGPIGGSGGLTGGLGSKSNIGGAESTPLYQLSRI